MVARRAFDSLVLDELLPRFCEHYGYVTSGFRSETLNRVIFWQGLKSVSPRPMTLWVEPVITIGAAGRLHGEFDWPQDLIGLQSKKKWAFDLVAYNRAQAPVVVCEVKKTNCEIDDLLEAMSLYVSKAPLSEEPMQSKLRNAYRKVVGLRRMKPELFWALGPDNYGKLFRFVPGANTYAARLEEVGEDALKYRTVRASDRPGR